MALPSIRSLVQRVGDLEDAMRDMRAELELAQHVRKSSRRSQPGKPGKAESSQHAEQPAGKPEHAGKPEQPGKPGKPEAPASAAAVEHELEGDDELELGLEDGES